MTLYARYLCSRDALGLKAARPSARDDRLSCIQGRVRRASKGILHTKSFQSFPWLYARFLCSRAHSAYAAARPSARATIGYLVYNFPGGVMNGGSLVYKIPYRRARAWPLGRVRRASKGILHTRGSHLSLLHRVPFC